MKIIDNIKRRLATNIYNNLPQFQNHQLVTDELINFNPYSYMDRNEYQINKTNCFYNSTLSILNKDYSYSNLIADNIMPEVFFTVDYISRHVAQMNIDIYKDTTENKKITGTKKHYMLNHKPNSYQSAYDLKYNLIFNLYMFGTAFAVYSPGVEYDRLEVLDNECIIKFWDQNQCYYYYGDKKQVKVINNTQINYDYLSSIKGLLFKEEELLIFSLNSLGLSPIEFLWQDLGLLTSLKNGIVNQVKLVGDIQGIVTSRDGHKGRDEQKHEHDVLTELAQSDKPGFRTVGSVDFSLHTWQRNHGKDLNPILKDMQKKVSERLGVPDGLLGGDSHQGKQDLPETFHGKTLAPLLKMIEQELENKLYSPNFVKTDGALVFDVSTLLRMDESTRTDNEIKKLDAGIVQINESRVTLGYEKLKDPLANILLPKQVFNEQTKKNNTQDKNNTNNKNNMKGEQQNNEKPQNE